MKTTRTRLLSLLLALAMVISMLPVSALAADGESTVVVEPETDIETVSQPDGDDSTEEIELPKAEVSILLPQTLEGGSYMTWPSGDDDIDRPLQMVMNFKALETVEEARQHPYFYYKCDFYLTFTGLAEGTITADDCYLAGNYGSFGWIVIPADGLELEEGVEYPVVAAYDTNITYKQICESVKNFTAAIYVAPEILEANPDFTVKLALKATDPETNESYVIGEPAVYAAAQLGLSTFVPAVEDDGLNAEANAPVIEAARAELINLGVSEEEAAEAAAEILMTVVEAPDAKGKVVYDVTPVLSAGEQSVKMSSFDEELTFRLPVLQNETRKLARVYHDGDLLGTYDILGDESGKYVEVSSADFSEFTVEPYEELPERGYTLYIYNADGSLGMDIDGTKSVEDTVCLRTALEDAYVFVDNAFLYGIQTPATYVVDLYQDTEEDQSFEMGADVTINGNGHKINLAQGVEITGDAVLNDVEIVKAAPAGVASVNGTAYPTLAEAIAAANDGDTVTLLTDVTLDSTLSIEKSITLDGDGFAIIPADETVDYGSAIMAGNSGWSDDHGETIKLIDLELSGWTAQYGVVRAQGVSLEMDGCTLSDNTVTNGAYGVLSLNYTDAAVANTVFDGNNDKAVDVNYNADDTNAVVVIDGCTFTNNESDGAGIVYRNAGKLTVQNNTFSGNTVTTTGNAATLYMGFGTDQTVTGNVFENNTVTTTHATSKRVAGAVFCDACVVTGNVFVNNTTSGGAEGRGDVAVGAYYGAADVSDNYWGGNEPNYTVEYSKEVANTGYYTEYNAETGELSGLVSLLKVAEVNGTQYPTLAEAAAAAASGDTITLLADTAIAEGTDVTIPAGVTLNGNGYAILASGADHDTTTSYGYVVAGGDLTIEGVTKIEKFSAGYYYHVITVGEGASLQITGKNRVSLGYGSGIYVTGSLENAKTADKATATPSLVVNAGFSIVGSTDTALSVDNAYVVIGSSSSKNSNANGKFDISFTNSVVEFTNQLTMSTPKYDTLNPVFNITFTDSVVTSATKFNFAAPGSNVVVDNSSVTLSSYLHNSGALTVKNGSDFTGSMIQYGENGGNSGTITVDNASFTIKNNNTAYAMDGKGTGKLVLQNNAVAAVDYIKETAVSLEPGCSLTTKTADLEVESSGEVTYADGTYTAVAPAYVAMVGEQGYTSVIAALQAAVEAGASEVKLLENCREVMPTDIELLLKADLAIVSATGEPVEAKFYNEDTSFDFIFNTADGYDECTLTIGENVTFQLEDRVIWAGYYGNDVDVVVDGTLAGYQYWHGAETFVNATGTLKTTGEALVMRRGATLFVDGGKVEANYFNVLAGSLFAENGAEITCGKLNISNTGNYVNEGNVNFTVWDSTFTCSGNLVATSSKADYINLDFYNSNVTFTNFEGYQASSIDANTLLQVNGEEGNVTFKDFVNNGRIDVYDGASLTVKDMTNNAVVSVDEISAYTAATDTSAVKVGTNYYSSLAKAVADAEDGDTVTLLADVALTDGITVEAGKTVTLDLAGKTISQSLACTESYQMISNKGSLTITDSVGGGKISFTDTGAGDSTFGWGSYTIRNEGTLVVDGGTIEHLGQQNGNGSVKHMYCAVFQYSGSTTINGGIISTPTYRSVRLWKGDMTINGGTFEGQVWVQSVDNSAKLTITDGTFAPRGVDGSSVFIGNVTDRNIHCDVEFSVTGGIFNTKIGANDTDKIIGGISGGTFTEAAKNGTNAALLAAGYEFGEADENGNYGIVCTTAYVANKAELNAALANTQITTIVLTDNILLTGKLTITRPVTIDGQGQYGLIADASAVWYTVSGKFNIKSYKTHLLGVNSDNVVLKGIVLDCNNNAAGINVYCAQNVVFDNVSIINATKGVAALTVNGSTLTAKNSFTALGNAIAIDISNGSNVTTPLGVTVEEGTTFDLGGKTVKFASAAVNDMTGAVTAEGEPYFVAMDAAYYYTEDQINTSTAPYRNGLTLLADVELTRTVTIGSKLNLNGNDLTVADGYVIKTGGSGLEIIGEGEISAAYQLTKLGETLKAPKDAVVTSSVAGTKVVYDETEGVYTLAEIVYVAEVDGVKYETFAEAVAAATDGDTVTVLTDTTLDTVITIEKAITLDLGGKTVTGANGAIVFNVKAATEIKNGTILGNKSGTSSGLIDIYADLAMEDVTIETSKIVALRFKVGSCTATLTDCSVTGQFKGYGGSVWNITSGTYKASSTSVSEQLNGMASVSGGTFHYAIDATDCAPGYKVVTNEDGTYTVEYAPVCFVDADNDGVLDDGEAVYGSLEAVFDTYQTGDVYVVLLDNATITEQVDTDADAKYYLNTNVAEGVTVDILFADDWNYIQKMYIGENVTLNAPYLLVWTELEVYGTINTDYLYITVADVLIAEGAVVNANTGDATIQVKNGADVTVNGTVNTAILNVWANNSETDEASELIVSGEDAQINARWIDIWDGAPAVAVKNGATVAVESIKASRGGSITVDSATLDAGTIEIGHNGESAGVLTETGDSTVTGEIKMTDANSIVNSDGGLNVTTDIPDHKVVYENGQYKVVARVYVAQNGEVKYESLTEALAAATDGDTVTLLADATGAGAVIDTDVVLDLNGYTYTFNKTVGSTGTTTLGLQILKDNNVTIKNGTLTSTAVTEGKEVKMLIQNYANLTLEDVALVDNTEHILYALSNNSGNVALTGTTSITTDAVAFDVYDYSAGGYVAPVVTVDTEGTIAGKIVVDGGELNLKAADIEGALEYTAGTVTKADAVELDAPEGYKWLEGVLTACVYVAEVNGVKYETFAEAAAQIATDGSDTTIKLLTDVELDESVVFAYGTGKIIFTADEPVTVKQLKAGLDLDFTQSNAANIVIEENVTFEIYDNTCGMYLYYGPSVTVNGAIVGGQNWGCLYLFNGDHVVTETGKVGVGRVQTAYNTLTVEGEMDTNYLLVEGATFTADSAVVNAGVIYDNNNGGQRWGASDFFIRNGSVVTTNKLTLSYADSELTISADSTLTAGEILGAGKIIIDAAGLAAGAAPIVGNASAFEGTIEVINNDALEAKIDENGSIVLVKKGLPGSGTEEDPFLIRTAEDLKFLRDVLNTKKEAYGIVKYAQGQYFKLGADIDLGGETWQPIYSFDGVLDGCDYKISNFKCDTANGNGGLTRYMYGTMKDLTVSDVTAVVGRSKIFAPIASTFKGSLDNVHTQNITVTITAPGSAENAPSMVGGMIAWDGNQTSTHTGTVKECSVENLTVTAENGTNISVGGFVNAICRGGQDYYDNNTVSGVKVTAKNATQDCQIGGFVAQTETGWNVIALDNCHVNGIDFTVSGDDMMIGGFIANPGAHTTVTNSTTGGKIDAVGATSGKIGGFVADLGWNNNLGDKGDHQFTKCSADVDIITGGTTYAGGFIGSTYSADTDKMGVVFTDCTVNGDVTAAEGYAGGFAGYADRGTYANSIANDPFFGTASGAATVTGTDGIAFYETFAEAVAAATDGDTVTLLADATGAGAVIDGDVIIDLNGHTYTFNKTVGSSGTTTLGLQILKNNNVTIKNGTLTSTTVTEGKEVKVLIQNYANLTLEDVHLVDNTEHILYALSNNSGEVALNGTTSITTDAVAFDVCKYASYEAPTVTVDTEGTIEGTIEVSGGALELNAGTIEGELAYTSGSATKAADVDLAAPEGYKWNEAGELVKEADDPVTDEPLVVVKGQAAVYKDIVKILYRLKSIEGYTEDEILNNAQVLVWTGADVNENATYELGTETEALTYELNNGIYEALGSGIPAKNMGDIQKFRICMVEKDGNIRYSDVFEYSLKQYAENIYGKAETKQAEKDLLVALMNYGAAAQRHFGHRTDDLMNSWLPEELQNVYTGYVSDSLKTDEAGKYSFTATPVWDRIGREAVYIGAIELQIRLKQLEEYKGAKYTLLYWSEEAYNASDALTMDNATAVEMVENSGGYMLGRVVEIPARKLGNTTYFCIMVEKDGETYYSELQTYSLHYYAEKLLTREDITDLEKDLCKSMLIYSNAAKSFFG